MRFGSPAQRRILPDSEIACVDLVQAVPCGKYAFLKSLSGTFVPQKVSKSVCLTPSLPGASAFPFSPQIPPSTKDRWTGGALFKHTSGSPRRLARALALPQRTPSPRPGRTLSTFWGPSLAPHRPRVHHLPRSHNLALPKHFLTPPAFPPWGDPRARAGRMRLDASCPLLQYVCACHSQPAYPA